MRFLTACGAFALHVAFLAFAASGGVTLPITFSHGHIMVPARVDDSGPLSFMLDSGYSLTMLHPAHASDFNLRRTGGITIVGIAGEERADVFAGPAFDFGGAIWTPRRVAAYPPTSAQARRKRDGILGSGFFKRFVVVIDPGKKELTLHDPADYSYAGGGEILPVTFHDTTPVVTATINVSNRPPISARFEIDTGCDDCLCVGRDFADAHQLDPVTAPSRKDVRTGVGGDTGTRVGHLPQMKLGQIVFERPRANFFTEGSPVSDGLAGHIGLDLLRQYKMIFDYSRQRIILEAPRGKDGP